MADTIKIGNLDISSFKVGSADCSIYLGDVKLYPTNKSPIRCWDWVFENVETFAENSSSNFALLFYSYNTPQVAKVVSAQDLVLPTTTLANNCYLRMFQGCASLTKTPELPATTLANNCYGYMFNGCTRLTTAPELPATTLANQCYYRMFQDCTNLTTALELSATTLTTGCYGYMFQGCTRLSSIKCLATDISATNCTKDWVSGVAASGTFTKAASMSGWSRGTSGIPSNWTVQDAA